MPKKYEIGQIIGGVTIAGTIPDERYKKYLLKCNTCGTKFVEYANSVRKHKNGCSKCKYRKNREKYYTKEIGKTYNNLKILEYDEDISNKNKGTYVKCQCLKCNSITSIPLTRIKAEKAKVCSFCSKKNLKLGLEFIKEDCVQNTRISTLKRKTNNKNNTSGYNGVSMFKNGKYRSYINFQRRQYYLGTYDTLEDAHKIRMVAEEKIYGEFLKWYAENFPDKWKKYNS